MTKPVAFAMFISSCVSAACLGLLAYNLMTGDLPFDMKPYLVQTLKIDQTSFKKKRATTAAPIGSPAHKIRFGEKTVDEFYRELEKEKAKLAVERENLAHERRVVEEIRAQALKSQEELAAKEKAFENLIVRIKDNDKDSLKRLASLISGMDTPQASEMLMELSDVMASKVLYFMNQKTASTVIAQVLKTKNDEKIERIKKITDLLYKLTEDGSL